MVSNLKFSDGVEFDTSGDYRIESRHDGLYVVGKGMLLPARDIEDAERILARMTRSKDRG